MPISPLFVKYQTKSGKFYAYDLATNEIVRIGKVTHAILDDYGVLTLNEIVEKYYLFGKDNVHEALKQLGKLQNRGILPGHFPVMPLQAKRIRCQGKEETLDDFLRNHRQSLTLELTQQCNLRCEYCSYGRHYPEKGRHHNDAVMTFDTAKAAVKAFLGHRVCSGGIAFYGGEPLLEFDLLRQIVLFAEEFGDQCGIKPGFSISTNGTLLTDEKLPFLVDHNIGVAVSLDGDKKTHDRYRRFRHGTNSEHKLGSYDIVVRNMKRFAELHPNYTHRSINLTLTATSDFEAINDHLKSLTKYWRIATHVVNDPKQLAIRGSGGSVIQCGCWKPCPCSAECYGQSDCLLDSNDSDGSVRLDSGDDNAGEQLTDFANWTHERLASFRSGHECMLEDLCHCDDLASVEEKHPLYLNHFVKRVQRLHQRPMGYNPKVWRCCRYPCFVGSIEILCSAQGVLCTCEKVNTDTFFQIGSAEGDVDIDRARRLIELEQSLGNCANCVLRFYCYVCIANLEVSQQNSGTADALAYQQMCRTRLKMFPERLKEYTQIMESNPEILDEIHTVANWTRDVKTILTNEQLREVEVGIEELESAI